MILTSEYNFTKRTPSWLSFFFVANLMLFDIGLNATEVNSRKYCESYTLLWQMRLQEVKTDISGPEGEHLKAMKLFLEIFARENEDFYNEKLGEYNEHLSNFKSADGIFAAYAAAELYILRATLRAKFNQNVKAAFDFWQGYRRAKKNIANNPDYLPNIMMWGIMESGLGSLPAQLQTYLGYVGFSGDLDVGLSMLETALHQSKAKEWSHMRPLMGLSYVSSKVQLGNDQELTLQKIGIDPQLSPFMVGIEAKIHFDRSDARKAYDLLDNRKVHPKETPYPYIHYLQGRIGITLEEDKGAAMLELYLRTTEGNQFVKSSHRYLWWHYFLKGNNDKAEFHRKKISASGSTLTGPDQMAAYEADQPLNSHLLRARLLFDRGDFGKCLSHIASKKADEVCVDNAEKGEYFYRMGRCLQNMNKRNAAIKRYIQSLEYYGSEETFERSNALLQLGFLYEQDGNCATAKTYFEKVLSFKNYPFNEGQHQKAKAAIKRCK